jgi:glycogen synthase
MNILYLCDEYPPGRHGGIGTAVQLLAREVAAQGHNVVVAGFYDWGYGGQDYFEDEGVKVYRFRRALSSAIFSKSDLTAVRAISKLLKILGFFHRDIKKSLGEYGVFLEKLIAQYDIDIIEMPDFHDYMRFCNSYIPFPLLSKPVIVKLHGSIVYYAKEANEPVPEYIWKMERDILNQAAAVTSVSKYTSDKTAYYLKYEKKILVLYNGIKIIENDTGVKKVDGRVIFTGSLMKKKGIFQLVKAWNIVNKKMPSARLLILGKGNTKKINALLNPIARQTVVYKGHVSRNEVLKYLATSSVGVFPSFAESFGLVPIESMMCGTATIFTITTSGPEIINDGEDGLLADPGNENDIANKILLLLEDKVYNSKLAGNGIRRVRSIFDIRKIAEDHISFYSSFVK